MWDKPESLCILRLSAIGDVCHAVAVVQAIQRHFPETRISWVIGKVEAALVADLPGIDFVVVDKNAGWREIARLRRQFPAPVDVLLHMQVSSRANLLALLLPARRKLGFPAHLSRELHGLAVSERVCAPPRPHVLEGFQAFAYALGVPAFEPRWDIPIPEEDRRWAREKVPHDEPLLLISPAASRPERCWSAEAYAAMAEYAVAKGYQVLITSGPAAWEQDLASRITARCSRPLTNLAGQTSLKQLLALLDRAQIVLAPDSGPAHMATTQGTPVIGLYAHSNPDRTGPYNSRHTVVETYHHNIQRQYGVSEAALPWGTRAKGDALMQEVSLEAVRQQFDRLDGA